MQAIQTLYISNPRQVALPALASNAAAWTLPLAEASATAASENWEAQRQAYWQSVSARSTLR